MKILVAGDLCSRNRLAHFIENGMNETVFGNIDGVVKKNDLSILNLECPIVNGFAKPIIKCGPNLKASPRIVDTIRYLGFKCVTLANNHFYDYGEDGVRDTINALDAASILHVGGGENLEMAQKTLLFEHSGEKVAIINVCEHEFSIASEHQGGSAPLDVVKNYYEIIKAKQTGAFVLVIVHGGHEHCQLPSNRMVETYRFFVDVGADAVVNHHQHCFSGYEIYKGKPIFYGLGNFCFDIVPPRENSPWNYGYMVSLNVEEKLSFELIPYEQCNGSVSVRLIEDTKSFFSQIEKLNLIIRDEEQLREQMELYYKKSSTYCEKILNPTPTKYLRFLQRKGFFPSLLRQKWLVPLRNYFQCESHREKMNFFMNNIK